MSTYGTTSRDHIQRSLSCLDEGTYATILYAALEVRLATEARLSEYLWAWSHISEKTKDGWSISKLFKGTMTEFSRMEKYMIFSISTKESNTLTFLYTPVTNETKSAGERLSGFLHSRGIANIDGDEGWEKLVSDIRSSQQMIIDSNTGTMLGPALLKNNKISMSVELIEETDGDLIKKTT